MVSPPLREYVLYVAQRCSESASKKTKKVLCPFSLSNQTYSSLNPVLIEKYYPATKSTQDD
jgi:hypothetical protein